MPSPLRPARRSGARFAQLCVVAALLASGCGETEAPASGDDAVDIGGQANDATRDGTSGDGGTESDGVAPGDSSDANADATADADAADPTGTCPGAPGCPCEGDDDCDGDDDACTVDPVCYDGFCSAPEDADCDDDNACTADDCSPATGCVHEKLTAAPGAPAPCEDGDFCTYADHCEAGACVTGLKLDCDDGDTCTDDTCVPLIGCQHMHNTEVCWDGNACVDDSVCAIGSCVAGKIHPCSDGNACTADRCWPETGCVGLPWNVSPTCEGGVQHDDACYRAHKVEAGIDWLAARDACAAKGDVLAVLPSRPAELAARAAVGASCGETGAFVGLDDRIRNGVWRWSDNSGLGWRNWNSGEPNNAGGEDVVELQHGKGWNDIKATDKRQCYVCMRRIAMTCNGPACQAPGLCAAGSCLQPTPLPTPATPVDLTDAATTTACDDRDPCTLDGCDKAGCSHVALPDGTSCTTDGGVCSAGACQMPTSLGAPPAHCAAILAVDPKAPTGVYTLAGAAGSGGTEGSHAALCEMGSAGGGWTLALKVSGKDPDFAFAGKGWSESTPLAPDSWGKQAVTARLPAYAGLALQEVLLRMVSTDDKGVTTVRELVIPLPGSSLAALLGGEKMVETALGAPAWRTLLPKSSLQPSCHLEGAVAGEGGSRVRLGVVGNNENNCKSSDSWLGIGGDPANCNKTGIVVGNVACYGANAKIDAFAYVFVR